MVGGPGYDGGHRLGLALLPVDAGAVQSGVSPVRTRTSRWAWRHRLKRAGARVQRSSTAVRSTPPKACAII